MYEKIIKESTENRELLQTKDKCDKYDYLAAVACGAVGGLVDIFLVGAPGESVLGGWTDAQIDKTVLAFARKVGWKPGEGKENNISSAIGYLERNYKVNYDQRSVSDIGGLNKDKLSGMTTKNHHMKSIAHSPDPVGLFFSILNQFTNTSAFISQGELIYIATDGSGLQGGNFIAKIFCGIANWFGHLMSDVAGSSGAKGRGTGIVMPFYELFGFCTFGKFDVGKDRQDLATIATRAFQNGMDFRFGLAQAIPVVITELAIRLIWAIRRRFQYHMPLRECIPSSQYADFRIMLLLGNGTLCVIDGIDAGIRSGGNMLLLFMRLNLVAWLRLVMLVLKEVCIRVGLGIDLQREIEAYKRINEALQEYLYELKRIDAESFKKETEQYNIVIKIFESAENAEELNKKLFHTYESLKIEKAWQGDFDEHMSDKNGTLEFE